MKRKYGYPLGLLARLMLWSAGEIWMSNREIADALGLLRAKLSAIEGQAKAVVRPPEESKEDESHGFSKTSDDQTDLPF